MEYTNLGRTGLKVSRLCLGTMNFGPKTDEATSHTIMDRALELGINFFDTADVYGWDGTGHTERIIGNWFAKCGERREKTILATKVFNPMKGGDDVTPNRRGLSARWIKEACEDSLRRLQTAYLDLYQMHHIDRSVPTDEILEAFELLHKQGKVVYFGSSNFGGWHIARFNERANARHMTGLVTEQSIYHLLNRNIEMEVVPACEFYGLGIIPWSPLGGGLLAGKPEAEGRRTEGWYAEAREKNGDKLDKWEALCDKLGDKPADVALAWLLSRPAVTAPIIGPRTMEQLDGSLRALEIKLDEETLKEIDEIFPGKKTSPEDYAW
ncbi:aldo/keto reductase [soil metagenome]